LLSGGLQILYQNVGVVVILHGMSNCVKVCSLYLSSFLCYLTI
jgi:hypothetical protein